jgi:hypothetical protein
MGRIDTMPQIVAGPRPCAAHAVMNNPEDQTIYGDRRFTLIIAVATQVDIEGSAVAVQRWRNGVSMNKERTS